MEAIKMDGYRKAAKIDGLINKLIKRQPPRKDNALEWLKFTRTVETTCTILRTEAMKALKKGGD